MKQARGSSACPSLLKLQPGLGQDALKCRYLPKPALTSQSLKRIKIILYKGMLLLVALQVLNLSADVDFSGAGNILLADNHQSHCTNSFAGYLLEKITGGKTALPEDSDEANIPGEPGMEKYETGPLYLEQVNQQLIAAFASRSAWTASSSVHKISKGYLNIISPPPEL